MAVRKTELHGAGPLVLVFLSLAVTGNGQAQETPPAKPAPRALVHDAPSTGRKQGPGKTYALLIGVSRYKQDPPVTSLQFADKDAETFADLLRMPIAGGLRDPDQIRLLTNERATRAAIDDAVGEIATMHASPQNTLILFVAAHGVYLKTEEDPVTHKIIQREPYILSYESNHQDPKTTGYPMEAFRQMAARQALNFGRVLVFLDVCHAANVAGVGGGSNLDDVVRKVWEGQAGELGFMLASHSKKFAIESVKFGGGHGAFSYFLISGLNGAATAPGSHSISFADLGVYVLKNVNEYTLGQQTPVQSATDDDMVLVEDATLPGMSLPPAQPMSDADVRNLRLRGAREDTAVKGATESPALGDAIDDAIRRGALLPGEPDNASDLLSKLRADSKQSAAAIREWERRLRIALEDRGQDVMSQYLLGEEVPQVKEDFDRCARLFEFALTLNPRDPNFDNSRALFCKGRAGIFARQYDESQRLLDESIRLDSSRAYSYNALGIAHLERISRSGNGFKEAEEAFLAAMRFAPYWAYPVHNLALLKSERGDYDGAIRLYQFAMSIAPRFSYLPYNLGLLYQRLGDFENSQLWFTKARDVLEKYRDRRGGTWPARSQVWNALGTIARAQGREGRARELFEKALADDPENKNARHNLAQLLAKQGDSGKAGDLWLKNITSAPDFIPSRVSYAESLIARGSVAAAIEQYEQILSRQPGYAGGREALARLYFQQGQFGRALAQLDQVIAGSSSNPTLLELRGDVYMRLGQRDAALADWNKARGTTMNRGDAKKRLDGKIQTAR